MDDGIRRDLLARQDRIRQMINWVRSVEDELDIMDVSTFDMESIERLAAHLAEARTILKCWGKFWVR